MFMKLKAAFDMVDRGVFIQSMRERGKEGLSAEKLLRETRSRIRV